MTEQQQTTITRNTRLTIGVAVVIFGGIVYQLNKQNEVSLAIKEVQRDIMEMRLDLQTAAADRWHGQDMKHWRDLLESLNPDLRVPEVTRNNR